MHSYSIDTNERKNGIVFLSVMSIFISYGIYNILKCFNVSFPSYIDGPSTLMIFGILYYIFDNFAWKWKIFRFIKLIHTPDLNGKWEGSFTSSYKDESGNSIIGSTTLSIEQSWTKIRIISEHNKSISCSKIAGIAINDNMGIVLRFQYSNEPDNDSEDSMNYHLGYNKLRYLKDGEMKGNYFNDGNRKTYGTLDYTKN